MKCNSSVSSVNSMSAEGCSVKLRILILVVNTANLINERATPTLGISHALTAPTALFTTYIFIGIFVIGAMYKHYASPFLQIYALVACCCIEIFLSLIVFEELKTNPIPTQNAALVLNGVLPMICAILLILNLIGILFSNRQEIAPPSISTLDSRSSQLQIEQRT